MPRVLVTGGAGFIGSNLVKRLLAENYQVTVIDNLSTGYKKNLEPYLALIKFVEGSIMDEAKINEAFAGVDFVLHQAALPSVPRSISQPMESLENNIAITLKVLLKSVEFKVKKVVYAGSSSAYGDQPVQLKNEDLKPLPLSPYAVYKLSGEYLCKVFADLYKLPTVTLRYFNVFGPNQDPTSPYSAVIPIFIKSMLAGQSPTINGDGSIARDFTYVDNNVEANLLALKSDKAGKGEVINISCGSSITLNDLADEINNCLQTSIKPIHGPERPGDIKHSLADIGLAKKLLGYEPKIDFKTGLKATIEYYKKFNS